MKVRKTLTAGLLSLGLMIALAACNPEDGSSSSGDSEGTTDENNDVIDVSSVEIDNEAIALLPEEIKDRGTLRAAMDLNYPPTSFKRAGSDDPLGFNVDFSHLLAARLGLELEINNVTFDTIVTGIGADRYDISATNMAPNAERLSSVDMVTYWEAGSALVVPKDNPDDIDINNSSVCGKKIAVHGGTTQADVHLPAITEKCEDAGEAAPEEVILPEVQQSLTQLNAGRVDGVFADTPQLAWAQSQQPEKFDLLEDQYEKPDGEDDIVALALPKDTDLTEAVEVAVRNLVDTDLYPEALARWNLESGAMDVDDVEAVQYDEEQ